MKKVMVLWISAIILFTSVNIAFATASVDLSVISGNSEMYEISVNSDDDIAFVNSSIPVSCRAFEHEYENPNYYSVLETDILIHDYFSSDPYAVMRTWIKYNATEYLYPTSATFTIEGKDYTFSGIGDKTWSSEDGSGGTMERMLIIYGNTEEHKEFLSAMVHWAFKLLNDDENDD